MTLQIARRRWPLGHSIPFRLPRVSLLTVAPALWRCYIYVLIVDRNAPALARRLDRGAVKPKGAVGYITAPPEYQEAMFLWGHRME